MKQSTFPALLVSLLAFLAMSCSSPPSVINTEGLGMVKFIAERHDAYAEALAGEPDKEMFLAESNELVFRISSADGQIPVSSITHLGNRVAARHDLWVSADQSITDLARIDYLRSSAIFRRVLVAATQRQPDT